MKGLLIVFAIIVVSLPPNSMYAQFYGEQPLVHTYSIVAFDPETGDMGVAVQSHWFSVGTTVIWGEAGVGVVATQSLANLDFGPQGLAMLRTGLDAEYIVEALVKSDPMREMRQLAVLNNKGEVAAHTGASCIKASGHIVGEHYSVQANLMGKETVWPAMAKAFENAKGSLAERMMAALEAAEEEGGDVRGKQSAALLVVKGEPTGKLWKDRMVDLRVDDHSEPIKELRRLLQVHQAYDAMNLGDDELTKGNLEAAKMHYQRAGELNPSNEEMKFWYAVTLANIGNLEDALPIFKKIFRKNADWRDVILPRIIDAGVLQVDDAKINKIKALK